MRLVSGREFTREDHDGGRRVAIISQSLARRYFQGRDPIGQELKLGAAASANPWLTVVGVVSDVTSFWFDENPRPIIYLPFSQNPLRTFYLAVRTSGDPMQAVGAVASEIKRSDKSLAVAKIKSLNQFINEQISGVRVAADFAFFLVIISLLLAITGVFGMTTISVTQRTREIGLRMAIGAQPRRVRAMVVVRSLKLVAIGIALGLPLSIATSASMASFLWGVGRFNLLAMAGQILLLVAVGLISSYVPAMRASTINPVQALQCE
jgi:putative ABC transport system permease protein